MSPRNGVPGRHIKNPNLLKRKQVIRPKIPEHHHTRGHEFGGVKLHVSPFGEEVDDSVVHPQTDERHYRKLSKLNPNMRIRAMKGPEPV